REAPSKVATCRRPWSLWSLSLRGRGALAASRCERRVNPWFSPAVRRRPTARRYRAPMTVTRQFTHPAEGAPDELIRQASHVAVHRIALTNGRYGRQVTAKSAAVGFFGLLGLGGEELLQIVELLRKKRPLAGELMICAVAGPQTGPYIA